MIPTVLHPGSRTRTGGLGSATWWTIPRSAANWPGAGIQVEIPSFHPVFRINADGSLRTDMVVEIVQSRPANFDEHAPGLGNFPFPGGATLIIRDRASPRCGVIPSAARRSAT